MPPNATAHTSVVVHVTHGHRVMAVSTQFDARDGVVVVVVVDSVVVTIDTCSSAVVWSDARNVTLTWTHNPKP
jgi:hypothetical protein